LPYRARKFIAYSVAGRLLGERGNRSEAPDQKHPALTAGMRFDAGEIAPFSATRMMAVLARD